MICGVYSQIRGRKAYLDGCTYLYWKSGSCFVKCPKQTSRNTITDRGVAMIPLPDRGRTQDWRRKKKGVLHVVQW